MLCNIHVELDISINTRANLSAILVVGIFV
jgi:hypothetical protein